MDMGTDSLTAVGLGVEQPDPQGMRLPPRLQDERLLNLPLALRAYLFLGLIEAPAMGDPEPVAGVGGESRGAQRHTSDC